MGLIAQEIQEIYPNLVRTDWAEGVIEEVGGGGGFGESGGGGSDSDGGGGSDGWDTTTPYKSVLYLSLIGPIVSAINTLNTTITQYGEEALSNQQAAINDLEARISTLENRDR